MSYKVIRDAAGEVVCFGPNHEGYSPVVKPTQVMGVESAAPIMPVDYAAARATEYPPIGDQLDAIWEGGAAYDAMRQKINTVKARHPKP